jgi:hypothetical protein
MNNASRNDVKKLAGVIENLARQLQDKVDTGADLFSLSEELVRNNVTFTYVIGEVIALERAGVIGKTVTATTVSNPNKTTATRNYSNHHNMRDARGRFIRKP